MPERANTPPVHNTTPDTIAIFHYELKGAATLPQTEPTDPTRAGNVQNLNINPPSPHRFLRISTEKCGNFDFTLFCRLNFANYNCHSHFGLHFGHTFAMWLPLPLVPISDV